MRGVPGADRAGRGRRRGARQRPGARARPRLGRVRRPPREPDTRARPRRGRGRSRHEAAVHVDPGGGRARRGGGSLADALGGMPVVCCSLHSQLAPACAGLGGELRWRTSSRRAARCRFRYRIPCARSRCADCSPRRSPQGVLRRRGRVRRVASALAWAAAQGHDAVVCAVGRGSSEPGRGSARRARRCRSGERGGGARRLARSGRAGLERRRAPAAPRRLPPHAERARALAGGFTVAWPAGLEAPEWVEPREEVDVDGWQDACAGLPLSHMGRGPDQEPWFFATAFAAGRLARLKVAA